MADDLQPMLSQAKDWRTLGRSAGRERIGVSQLHSIAQCLEATDEFKAMVARLCLRRPDLNLELDTDPEELPPGFPVLTAKPAGMGWVCACRRPPDARPLKGNWPHALAAITEWARKRGIACPDLWLETSNIIGQGRSGGLSAFLTAAQLIFDLKLPGNFAATGAWKRDGKDWRFEPVNERKLEDKMWIAREWGYDHLVLVEKQPHPDPPDGLSILYISPIPEKALLQILAHPCVDHPEPAAALELLYHFDQACVEEFHPEPYKLAREIVAPFRKYKSSALVRAVAEDICSRAALYNGEPDAAAHLCASEELLSQAAQAGETATGFVGDYLEHFLPAHRAIVALNTGHWDPKHDAWTGLDRSIKELRHKRILRTEVLAGLLELFNARALCRHYRGRLKDSRRLLRAAWGDFVALRQHWPAIFDYHCKACHDNLTLHRQHNFCLEVLWSEYELGLAPDWNAVDWLWYKATKPAKWERDSHHNPSNYDALMHLVYTLLRKREEDLPALIDAAQTQAANLNEDWKSPLIFEVLVRFQTSAALAAARELETSLAHPAPKNSILSILWIRRWAVLEEYHLRTNPRRKPAALPKRGNSVSALGDLAEKLLEPLRADWPTADYAHRQKLLGELIRRCPY